MRQSETLRYGKCGASATSSVYLCRRRAFFYRGVQSNLWEWFDWHANPEGDVGQKSDACQQKHDEEGAIHPGGDFRIGSQTAADSTQARVSPRAFNLMKELDE